MKKKLNMIRTICGYSVIFTVANGSVIWRCAIDGLLYGDHIVVDKSILKKNGSIPKHIIEEMFSLLEVQAKESIERIFLKRYVSGISLCSEVVYRLDKKDNFTQEFENIVIPHHVAF